jgi:hypothetical protein
MTHLGVRRVLTLLATLAALVGANPVTAESDAGRPEDATIDAVWKPQRLAFKYHGYSTFYSCRGLAVKLEHILLSMGAREDLRLDGLGCNEQQRIARFEIVFHSPVEATPENVRELTTYDATDELVARTRGETLVSDTDLPRFAAQWQEVSFASDHRMRLEPQDCELVQAIRGQILARMSVRILHDRLHCSPGYGNSGTPRLTVNALVPVERPSD